MADPGTELTVETKWLKLGMAIAAVHMLFIVLIVVLLQIDPMLAIAVAMILGTGGGIALVVFVLYFY